jgi:hypothetical protein
MYISTGVSLVLACVGFAVMIWASDAVLEQVSRWAFEHWA